MRECVCERECVCAGMCLCEGMCWCVRVKECVLACTHRPREWGAGREGMCLCACGVESIDDSTRERVGMGERA